MSRPILDRITPPSTLTPDERTNFLALVQRTDTTEPKESDLAELTQFLDRYPELWDQVGSLSLVIQNEITMRVASGPLMGQAMLRLADNMRRSLSLPTDGGTEQMLIEHCIVTYLSHYELLMMFNSEEFSDYTPADLNYLERRVTISENRYLKAIETLARVRNLALPLLQINIAQNHLNLTSPNSAASPPPRLIDQPS